jgi:hypothetical protein
MSLETFENLHKMPFIALILNILIGQNKIEPIRFVLALFLTTLR